MANQPLEIIQNSQKQMPCNIEAEQALIGSVLVSNDIYDEITLLVNSQKFFDPIHAKIFDTIEMLISKGLLANPITLKNHFENNEGLKELGGQEYLIKITKFSTTSVKQAIDYANIVHEMHVRRELIKISESVLNQARSATSLGNSEVKLKGVDDQGDTISGNNDDFSLTVDLEDLPKNAVAAAKLKYRHFISLVASGVISLPATADEATNKVLEIYNWLKNEI